MKCANNHYHLLQERKVTYITVTNLQRMSTMLDLDGMGCGDWVCSDMTTIKITKDSESMTVF